MRLLRGYNAVSMGSLRNRRGLENFQYKFASLHWLNGAYRLENVSPKDINYTVWKRGYRR